MADKKFADYIYELMDAIPKVNGNPMMSATSMTDENARYRENPFYISRQRQADQLALDEAEKRRLAAGGGGGGMMASGIGGDSPETRNHYAEREAQLRASNLPEDKVQSILRAEQEANNARLAAGLNLFANAFVPGVGLFNAFNYGQALPDYLQGNYRTMVGDSGGFQSPFTPKAEGIAAPVVSGQDNYNTYYTEPIFSSDWTPSSSSDWSPSSRTQEQMDYTQAIGDFSV